MSSFFSGLGVIFLTTIGTLLISIIVFFVLTIVKDSISKLVAKIIFVIVALLAVVAFIAFCMFTYAMIATGDTVTTYGLHTTPIAMLFNFIVGTFISAAGLGISYALVFDKSFIGGKDEAMKYIYKPKSKDVDKTSKEK